RTLVGDHNIRVAVTIEVANCYSGGLRASRIGDLRCKSAITIVKKDTEGVGAKTIGYKDIGFTVAVEVCERDRIGEAANWIVRGRTECAVAVAELDRDRAGRVGFRHKIGFAVTIDVTNSNGAACANYIAGQKAPKCIAGKVVHAHSDELE